MAASCNTDVLLHYPCACISHTCTMVKPLVVVETHLHWYFFEKGILLALHHPDLVIILPAIALAVHCQETGLMPGEHAGFAQTVTYYLTKIVHVKTISYSRTANNFLTMNYFSDQNFLYSINSFTLCI